MSPKHTNEGHGYVKCNQTRRPVAFFNCFTVCFPQYCAYPDRSDSPDLSFMLQRFVVIGLQAERGADVHLLCNHQKNIDLESHVVWHNHVYYFNLSLFPLHMSWSD